MYACCQEVPDAVESAAMVRMLQAAILSSTLNIELLNQCVKKNPDAAGWKHSVSGTLSLDSAVEAAYFETIILLKSKAKQIEKR